MIKTWTLDELIPHRPPMRLLTRVCAVAADCAEAQVDITALSAFAVGSHGVPSWVGLEYMGQTAALIAGFQESSGLLEPHTGFLLGARRFRAAVPYFALGESLAIRCEQVAGVGLQVAAFDCTIRRGDHTLGTAQLSVFRAPATASGPSP